MTLQKKLRGYRSQDEKWEIYSEPHFIRPEQVIQMLTECKYTCYYCQQTLKQEYTSRDPLQWTLDRIDNSLGHNKNNVLISCLQCNLKRRKQGKDAFLFTKQLQIVKKS